ncbi:MAG: glycosyltransferase family 4 protein [Myxococcales bacterium]|nr:glycosyltransferase family 4 protein [Myxococcales bacterium]
MPDVVLPTYEFHPVNPGGAGVLIAGAARALARAGYRVTLLCDFPQDEVARAEELLSCERLGPGSVRAVHVSKYAATKAGASAFEANAARFARALEALHAEDPIGLVEVPDYGGMGLIALRRRCEGALAGAKIAVRAHGSLELIEAAERVPQVDPAQIRMHRMEREALKLADHVLVPSSGMAELYRQYYSIAPHRLVVSPPPMDELLAGVEPIDRFPDPGHFLFYGKLQEVKGCDLLAEAAVSLLCEHPPRHWRFTLVGRDMHCGAHNRRFSSCLERIVPRLLRGAFEMIPSIDRAQLRWLCRRPVAAIVPSRFETFCLAAHELRALGLPLIVPRIAAFRDYLHEQNGCLTFDGTANGLGRAILRIRDEPGLADELTARPRPTYPVFPGPYHRMLRESQVGVGCQVEAAERGSGRLAAG